MIVERKSAAHNGFFSNVAMLSLLNILSALLPLLLLPFYLKTLGASAYGLILLSQVFCLYLVIICDYGFNLFLPREIASNKENLSEVCKIISSVFIVKIGLLLISFVALILATQISDQLLEISSLLLFAFIYVIANALNPMSIFQGFEVLQLYSLTMLATKLLSACGILIFIAGPGDAELVLLIQGSFSLLGSAILFVAMIIKFKLRFLFVSFEDIYRVCKGASVYFISRLSNEGLSNTVSFLLGIKLGPDSLSIFYSAERFYRAGLLMLTPITQSLYPYMTRVKNIKFFTVIFGAIILAASLGISMSFIFIDQILILLFDSLAGQISEVYKIFMLALWLGAIGTLLGFPFLGALGHIREANVSIVYGAFMGLVILLVVYLFSDHVVFFVFPLIGFEAVTLFFRAYFIRKNRVGAAPQ